MNIISVIGVAGVLIAGAFAIAQESRPALDIAARRIDGASATGFLFKTIRAQDREYRYAVYIPRDYDASKSWPVIVFLHGAGECGTDGSKPLAQGIGTAIMLDPEEWPFIVLFPQKPARDSQWEDHDAAVMAMVESAKSEFKVDASRLYLTGLSQGGHGTWAIAADHPELWAGIAPICGYGDPGAIAAKVKGIPTWCFHGAADDVVPPKQTTDIVAAIKAAGGDAKVTLYPGVNHNSWDRAYREEKLGEWLLEQKKKN